MFPGPDYTGFRALFRWISGRVRPFWREVRPGAVAGLSDGLRIGVRTLVVGLVLIFLAWLAWQALGGQGTPYPVKLPVEVSELAGGEPTSTDGLAPFEIEPIHGLHPKARLAAASGNECPLRESGPLAVACFYIFRQFVKDANRIEVGRRKWSITRWSWALSRLRMSFKKVPGEEANSANAESDHQAHHRPGRPTQSLFPPPTILAA
jgi:hypothetical protein